MNDHYNAIPDGDVVEAREAMKRIDAMLSQTSVNKLNVDFRLSGTTHAFSRADAASWIEESLTEGFSKIRFIIHRLPGGAVQVELAAVKPAQGGSTYYLDEPEQP